jgi:phosphate-selective porin OprO/OprP
MPSTNRNQTETALGSMITHRKISSLALAAALGWTVPAHAQDAQSDTLRAEMAAMREQMATMAAKIDQLESELDSTEAKAEQASQVAATASEAVAAAPAPAPAEKLAKKGGWSFTPFGRLMVDAGTVNAPGSIADPGLGFANEVRRARIGVKGDIGSGFGYKTEFEFADNTVEVTDAFLTYGKDALEVTVGQHNNFQGLEELTSSRFTSFMERAAFTDAFGFQRRIGLSSVQPEDGRNSAASWRLGPLPRPQPVRHFGAVPSAPVGPLHRYALHQYGQHRRG